MCFLLRRYAGFSFMLLFTIVFIFYSGNLQKLWFLLRKGDLGRETLPQYPSPRLRNIFFVETSCALLDVPSKSSSINLTTEFGGLRLSGRTACALEAAARNHPQRPVYLVHTCPLDFGKMWTTVPDYTLHVLSMPNVQVWPVRLTELFAGSPLETLLSDEKLGESLWPVVHASDILRFFLLWRFGGTYLDTDVLLLRPLGAMQNYACADEPTSLNNAVLDFARDITGLEVADACIQQLSDYHPNQWAYNGPHLISRVIRKRCGTNSLTSNVSTKQCGGFHLLPISDFYPVDWTQWEKYYTENEAAATMRAVNNSRGVHMWNFMSSKKPNIPVSSLIPYAQIARRVCPGVVATVGKTI